MKNYKKLLAGILFLGVCILIVGISKTSIGNITTSVPSITDNQFQEYTFFATTTGQTNFATTTTAVSTSIEPWFDANSRLDNGYFVIAGAEKVNLIFQRGDVCGVGNTGTSTFSVQVAEKPNPTESDWHDYNELKEITTTATADTYFTRVSSTNSGASDTNDHIATSTVLYEMDNLGWYAIRTKVTVGTDGESSIRATAQF